MRIYRSEGILFSMGRKPINNYVETSFRFEEGTEFRLYDVDLPDWSQVEIEISTNEYGSRARTTEIIGIDSSKKEKILQLYNNSPRAKKWGCKVLSIKPHTVKLTSICPQCYDHGIPKIEKKDTTDYRIKTGRYVIPPIGFRDEVDPDYKGERAFKYYLSYLHGKGEKCWIREYISYPRPSFKQNNKKFFDIREYFFPYCLDDKFIQSLKQ